MLCRVGTIRISRFLAWKAFRTTTWPVISRKLKLGTIRTKNRGWMDLQCREDRYLHIIRELECRRHIPACSIPALLRK